MNISLSLTQNIPAEGWSALSNQFSDLTYEQSLTYSQAAAKRIGAEVLFLRIERGGALVAAAAVRIKKVPGVRRGIAWIASGPLIMPYEGPLPDEALYFDVLSTLHEELVVRKGHILRLRFPGIAFQEPEKISVIAARAGFVPAPHVAMYQSFAIDLRLDEGDLMKTLNGKWRTDLRYALKSELTLESGYSPNLMERFLVLFREVQEIKGFCPDISPEFHFALQGSDFRRDILIATKDGVDIAGIVTGSCGQSAIYLFGATSEAGRRLRAGYFLTWQAINLARSRGLVWYDLGGVDFKANPSVARFKERMNGRRIFAAGPYEAQPVGILPYIIRGLETLRAKMKARG